MLSLCVVVSAFRIGSPSSNHVTLAGGKDPHVSQRKGTDLPATNRSLADTILILIGFTVEERKIYTLNTSYNTLMHIWYFA